MNRLVLPESESSRKLRELLDALGARLTVRSLADAVAGKVPADAALILPEDQLIAARKLAFTEGRRFPEVFAGYSKILVYPFAATAEGLDALGDLLGMHVQAVSLPAGSHPCIVSGSREQCGPFSGLAFPINTPAGARVLALDDRASAETIVACDGKDLFTRFRMPGCEVFVTSSADVFDVNEERKTNLAAAESFCGLVLLLFFLRYCGLPFWRGQTPWANWIIDDPNLTPDYGFLSIRDLATSVLNTNSAVTIAFIPWNHSRISREITRLFQARWPQLAICFHGCDHTASEFAVERPSSASALIALACERMRRLKSATSLGYEKVMVFPQGRFSASAIQALRQSEILAAVNTELIDCRSGGGVRAGELLKPAVTSWSGFPLFLRRPAEEPPENFALDLFLGKPCLIVTHHQYFQKGMGPLMDTVRSLNKLEPGLKWTSLENGISSTYLTRETADQTLEVQSFGVRTEFVTGKSRKILLTKYEPLADEHCEVSFGGRRIDFARQNGHIAVAAEAPAGKVTIEVALRSAADGHQTRQALKYRLAVAARRYLSEFRDNYVDKSATLKAGVVSVRRLIAGGR